jgi:hypothetical protein
MPDTTSGNARSASERLAESRTELKRLFEPPPEQDAGGSESASKSGFPRSAIMKAITKNRGATGIALLAIALFASRPKLAIRLLRYVPVSAITRSLISRFIESRQAPQARH